MAAADSTGLDTSGASRYFVRRRDACSKQPQTVSYRRFPKLEMVCDCRTHLVLCAFAGIGPTPDVASLRRLLFCTLRRVGVQTLLADAGYDSESNHSFARDGCGVRSVTPSTHGRPCTRAGAALRGRHRRRLQRLRDFRYGQRWQVETVVSMIKRNLGQCVAARSDSMRSKEVMLKVLTHNLMLIAEVLIRLFYRAFASPLSCPPRRA
ncbi:MAG: transposase [Tepidisphaeraceae bacterium]